MRSAANVLGKSPAQLAVFLIALVIPFAPEAQVLGSLTGVVTDNSKAPLPGVKVTVLTTSLERTALTGPDGSYQFKSLPPGTYTAKAELAGFDTAVENIVVVDTGATTTFDFALNVGCIEQAIQVDVGFGKSVLEATAILQIRILKSGSGERCPVTGFCVCTEHEAEVIRVVKPGPPDVSLTTIRFFQEGAGRIPENGRSGAEKPYAPGQEYVAFLRWDPATERFLRFNGPTYIFPIRANRVEFRRTDAAGMSDEMLSEEFIQRLRALVSTTRR